MKYLLLLITFSLLFSCSSEQEKANQQKLIEYSGKLIANQDRSEFSSIKLLNNTKKKSKIL